MPTFTLGGGKSEKKGREKLGYSTDLRALEQLTVIDDFSLLNPAG